METGFCLGFFNAHVTATPGVTSGRLLDMLNVRSKLLLKTIADQ